MARVFELQLSRLKSLLDVLALLAEAEPALDSALCPTTVLTVLALEAEHKQSLCRPLRLEFQLALLAPLAESELLLSPSL